MVVDAVRTYLDAASGLTELSRKQAVAAAKTLLRASGSASPSAGESENMPPRVGQSIQTLAGELIETSQSNRAAIADLVRSEVERQLERMDVVPRAEHERLVRRVAELERRLAARQVVERALAPVGVGASSPLRAPDTAAPGAPTDDADDTGATEAAGAVPAEEGADAEEADDTARSTVEETSDTPDTKETGSSGGPDTPEDGGGDDAEGETATARRTAAKKPRTTAKNSRPRSGTKRTTKNRGGTKK
ncbi:accessory factor UbiK family protein [Nocardiopsis halotolerans]|uniref:accessory factor UbiK family protein n=1 Tax=Nocardiopsis halotolerans TaxID=124252 RepID=UPI0003456B67|nr:hypothetical protein [Nocardiopsis halotolerans]